MIRARVQMLADPGRGRLGAGRDDRGDQPVAETGFFAATDLGELASAVADLLK